MQTTEGPNGRRALKLVRATTEELAAIAEKKRQVKILTNMPTWQ